jgi:enamine deaminase RidA (YjgF/YER057c/UK114 family)
LNSAAGFLQPQRAQPHSGEGKASIRDVQREFYPDPGPTSTAVRVSGFAFEDLLLEIEAIAVCRE